MDLQLIIFLGILAVTVVLIVTESFRIDVVAIMAMLSLVWAGSITPEQARSGFASNAVLAVMGVMIMGRGLHTSGITDTIAGFILRVAGTGKRRSSPRSPSPWGLCRASCKTSGRQPFSFPS